ncbi:selenium cofactor biosynthesis protein YqeC [Halorarius litoreus]|uniref:selenium cofactor biosynthesis protein YqeC n=1 Tax=Halorarius litoreus TaxID=2962676 RepID=UPI0020CF4198|nr:selenium cofactor biosynthesis protein YqeC [Halorarius litoreus]
MDLHAAFPGRALAFVGAGGKKTSLYALATAWDRAVLTTTVRIPPFRDSVHGVVTDAPLDTLGGPFPLGLAAADEGDRLRGYAPEAVDEVIGAHDGSVLVKADGARTRLLKAPDDHEPRIPSRVDTVVPVASVQAVGKPLDPEFVHRPERVAAVTGLAPGDTIEVAHVAEVLASPDGGLKDVPERADVVPLVNMADDPDLEATAREIAGRIHERADVRYVVVARMNVPEIVAVV